MSGRVKRRIDARPSVTTVERHFAGTRYDTSAAVWNRFFPAPSNFAVVTGANWPDAAVLAPYAGNRLNVPLLLAQQNDRTAPSATTCAAGAPQPRAAPSPAAWPP